MRPTLVVVKAIVPITALVIMGHHMFLWDPSACSAAVGTSAKGLFPECHSYAVVKIKVTADLLHE